MIGASGVHRRAMDLRDPERPLHGELGDGADRPAMASFRRSERTRGALTVELKRCETASQWLARSPPHPQGAVSCGEDKVVICGQQLQLVTDAELRDHGIHGAELHPGTTTSIAQSRSVDVILPVRSQGRQGAKPFRDFVTCPGSAKPLQQFLQDQSCDYDGFAAFVRGDAPRVRAHDLRTPYCNRLILRIDARDPPSAPMA